jgi:hypothetical protein
MIPFRHINEDQAFVDMNKCQEALLEVT